MTLALVDLELFVELWYLLPTAIAALLSGPTVVLQCDDQNNTKALGFWLSSMAVSFGGLLVEATSLCEMTDTLDLFRTPTLVFVGCDLAFAGLLLLSDSKQHAKQS